MLYSLAEETDYLWLSSSAYNLASSLGSRIRRKSLGSRIGRKSLGSRIGWKWQRWGAKRKWWMRASSLLFCGLHIPLRGHRHNDQFLFIITLLLLYYIMYAWVWNSDLTWCHHVCRLCNLIIDSRRAVQLFGKTGVRDRWVKNKPVFECCIDGSPLLFSV